MKRKRTKICAALVLLSLFGVGVQALRVLAALYAQEQVIKEALRTAPPGTLQSNASDGARRFIETGELVFELSYLLTPVSLKQSKRFNMKVHPRVTTHRNDGWVGIYKGSWYVKIY